MSVKMNARLILYVIFLPLFIKIYFAENHAASVFPPSALRTSTEEKSYLSVFRMSVSRIVSSPPQIKFAFHEGQFFIVSWGNLLQLECGAVST